MVYDPVQDETFYLPDYYQAFEAVAERRYERIEAILLCLRHGTYGPWHETAGRFAGDEGVS